MALDGVPWFIGGDAEHGPDVARQLLYLATGGKQGVGGPTDLKVVPLDVPGGGVKVLAGGGTILNRVASQQSYGVRNPVTDSDTVKIAATGSSGGRSDLVICRVDNPYVDGNAQAPSNPAKGPYTKFDVIPNVPAGMRRLQDVDAYKGLSAIELARIDLSTSDGTVTTAKITDLRTLATPRTERVVARGTIVDQTVTLISNGWQNFPQNPITGIPVPTWATHATIQMRSTLRYLSGNAAGNLQGFLGPAGQLDATTLYGDQTIDATTTGGEYRQPLENPSDGYWPVPASIRGTTAQLTSRIRGAVTGGKVRAGAGDYYYADITFTERIS